MSVKLDIKIKLNQMIRDVIGKKIKNNKQKNEDQTWYKYQIW
jgi:hypothetical protein